MHITLLEMMKLNPRPFDLPLLKMTLRRLLLALDFLHIEAEVIQGDHRHWDYDKSMRAFNSSTPCIACI
jgi:hypothetical protein